MSSRMDKYYDNQEFVGSRTNKNARLYQEINEGDLENINLSSNAHVIGDNDKNIDIEKIKELLERKYSEEPQTRNSLQMPIETLTEDFVEEITKEYNINAILEKARNEKKINYDQERLKKIHDTQYDILRNLNIDKDIEDDAEKEKKEENLMQLINTITANELTENVDPLDLLSDLKGSGKTEVYEGMPEKLEKEESSKSDVDNSFYTNSMSFTQSDFDDFNDLKEDMISNKIIIRILLIVVAIAIIVGLAVLAKTIIHF